jgi:site-specific recombinase XerD
MWKDESLLIKFEEALNRSALSSSTITNYLADLRAFLRWGYSEADGHFSLCHATQIHIRLYRDYLAHKLNRAASTINRRLMALRKFFVFAQEIGAVSADPTRGIGLVRDDGQTFSRSLSIEEVMQLLEAAHTGARAGLVRRDVAILLLLLNTGLRVSEIVNLRKHDVIFDHPGVRLKVEHGRDEDKARYLPLPSEVCKALSDYLLVRPNGSNSPHFFLSQEGRSISSRTVQRIISDCAREAGLEGVSAQSLRRTFAMQLFLETNDLELVSRRLGHQSKTITEQYLSVQKYGSGENAHP